MLIKAQNIISRNENYNFKIKISVDVLDTDKERIHELEERFKESTSTAPGEPKQKKENVIEGLKDKENMIDRLSYS